MATLAELSQRRDALIRQIAELEARVLADNRQITLYDQRIVILPQNSERRKQFESARANLVTRIGEDSASIRRLQLELDEVKSLIAGIQQQPVQSAGEITERDSRGRQEAANTTLPTDANGRIIRPTSPSNATRPSITPTSGTNAETRTARSIQGLNTATAEPGPADPSPKGPFAGREAGAAAPGEDAGSNATTQRLNAIFGGNLGRIITQPNVLDEYLTYTYNVSIYIMTPGQYQQLMSSRQKNLAGFQLLMRSGGAPLAGASTAAPDVGDETAAAAASEILQAQGRNQYFPLDYYIDDIRMRSIIQGKGSGGAHNVVELGFKIYEPNGISFIQNLQKAAAFIANLSGNPTPQNYAAQVYLMVIRFYGQDPDGNQVPVKGTYRDENGEPSGKPEVIEKYIPFLFTGIKFRIVQKVTEYECTAVCPQNFVNTSRARGVIPYNVEITSKTLKDLFAGKLGFSATRQTNNTEGRQAQQADVRRIDNANSAQQRGVPSGATGSLFNQELGIPEVAASPVVVAGSSPTQGTAPPKADAAATPTINQGLFEALNKYQKDLVAKGTITYPDEYEIEIDPILAQAQVVPPGQINKFYTAMNTGQTARDKKDPATNRMDTTTKNTSAIAGMSIVQFIDQYTRTSTYIYDQQIVTYDPKTGEPKIRPYIPGQIVAWYHIGLQAEPKLNQWDPKRRDYAYRIKFSLIPYQINDLKSDFFPQGRFQGAHKIYDFWFTGQNSQVINFEQDFNYLYYLVINNPVTTEVTNTTGNFDQYQDEIRRFYQPRSDQSSQGQEREVNEPSANAADYLYSPADQARVKLTIVGDPAWIQQGELWQGVSGLGFGDAFLRDGTISFDNREVMFEVAFNLPTDYDLDSGLIDAGANNFDANRSQNLPGRARQRYVYRAIEVTSSFSQGKFTQDLEGVLVPFNLPRARSSQITDAGLSQEVSVRSSPFSAGPDESSAETRRLQAAQNQSRFGGGTLADRANRAGTTLAVARQAQLNSIFGQQNDNPLVTDSVGAEGFLGDSPPPSPPTSSGISVGPAAAPSSLFGVYGALGTGTGSPAVTFTTQTGRVVTITSEQDLREAFNQGFINRVTQNELRRQLNQLQQQANNPVSNQPSQPIVRET